VGEAWLWRVIGEIFERKLRGRMEKSCFCIETKTLGQRKEHWFRSPFPTVTKKGVIGMVQSWR